MPFEFPPVGAAGMPDHAVAVPVVNMMHNQSHPYLPGFELLVGGANVQSEEDDVLGELDRSDFERKAELLSFESRALYNAFGLEHFGDQPPEFANVRLRAEELEQLLVRVSGCDDTLDRQSMRLPAIGRAIQAFLRAVREAEGQPWLHGAVQLRLNHLVELVVRIDKHLEVDIRGILSPPETTHLLDCVDRHTRDGIFQLNSCLNELREGGHRAQALWLQSALSVPGAFPVLYRDVVNAGKPEIHRLHVTIDGDSFNPVGLLRSFYGPEVAEGEIQRLQTLANRSGEKSHVLDLEVMGRW